MTGGALELELHHPWTYLFVNLGLGGNVSSNFNISLTPQLLNVTGKGTFCLPTLPVPEGAGARDGQPATLQVVTSGDSGSALYNVSFWVAIVCVDDRSGFFFFWLLFFLLRMEM